MRKTQASPARKIPRYSNGRPRRDAFSLPHDVSTMTRHAYDRVRAGLPMPGVFEVPQSLPVGRAIEEVLLVAELSIEGEWANQVRYLPV